MSRYRSEIIVSLFLIITTLAVYWQVRNYEFIYFDDNDYVTQNRYVRQGWTMNGIIWAFTTNFQGHWHPLTWISHMTDCELFGLNPGWHHLTSVFLHIANTLLLFIVFKLMTGALLQSAFVAALFALHPLHVETVAWIADRKDVLSTFFWMLTMLAYFYYSKSPGIYRYLLTLLFFALGMMAKSMVVTLPVIFLLMDYWPLRRFQPRQSKGKRNQQNLKFLNTRYKRKRAFFLLLEKVGFFIIAGVSILITFSARHQIFDNSHYASYSRKLIEIIDEPLVYYVSYIGKMIWPVNLIIHYSRPDIFLVWQVVGAGLLILFVSFLVFWKGRRYPYLPAGWLWYLVTLVPVIGLVRSGPHNMADRYTYVPLIGLFVMIAWGIPDMMKRWRYRRVMLSVITGMFLLAITVTAWLQVRYWQDSGYLFEHALNVDLDNPWIHNNLGVFLKGQGRINEAIEHFNEALYFKPNYDEAYNNLASVLLSQGKFDEAAKYFNRALHINPDYAEAHNNLAVVLVRQGKIDKAIEHFNEALRINPHFTEAQINLKSVLRQQRKK